MSKGMICGFLLFSILLIGVINCTQILLRENDPHDIKEATDFTSKFYDLIAGNKLDSAAMLFSNSTGFETAKLLLEKIKTTTGDVLESNFEIVKTNYKEEKNKIEKKYSLQTTIKYTGGTTKEQIDIINVGDSLKIDAYNVKLIIQ